MTFIDLGALALSASMAVAAGIVGCFAVMRRMTLAADAISHIALPGIGIALMLGISPLIGAMFMLLMGTFLIWGLKIRTRISTETVIGVVFTLALAVGSFLTAEEELIEALFGASGELSVWEIALGSAAALGVVLFILALKHALVVALISPDIASTSGIAVKKLDLGFLLAFALTVGLGIRYLGVLLMGALLIIPAVTARRLATNLTTMLLLSCVIAVLSTLVGLCLGIVFEREETGPFIVCVAGAMFFLSLFKRQASW